MNTSSASTGSCTEIPFWYLQFDRRQNGITRGSQPFVESDAADNCRLNITTMKAMNFQDDIPSIPIVDFKDHYVLVFDLTSMQEATKNCHYPELLGEPLRLELNFIFPLQHVAEPIVLGERMSSVAVDKFGVVGKIIQNGSCFSPNTIGSATCCRGKKVQLQPQRFSKQFRVVSRNRIPQLKNRYRSSIPSDCVFSIDNDTFAMINKQRSKMKGEQWILIANSCQILFSCRFSVV